MSHNPPQRARVQSPRRPAPRRPGESLESYWQRTDNYKSSIDAQKSEYYNRIPSPDASGEDGEGEEEGEDYESEPETSSVDETEVEESEDDSEADNEYHLPPGARSRPPRQYLTTYSPPVLTYQNPVLEGPHWEEAFRSVYGVELSEFNARVAAGLDTAEWMGRTSTIPQFRSMQETAFGKKRSRDDNDDNGDDADADTDTDHTQADQCGRSAKRRRTQHDSEMVEGQFQDRNSSMEKSTSQKRKRKPEEDECGGDAKRRNTSETVESFPTSSHMQPAQHRNGNDGTPPTSRKRSRELEEGGEDECANKSKRIKVANPTAQKPRPARQSAKRQRPSPNNQPDTKHPTDNVPPPPVPPPAPASTTPAPALITPAPASNTPAPTRRQTRSTKPAVLVELGSRGKASVQRSRAPRNAPNTAPDAKNEDLDQADEEPKPARGSKVSRQRKTTSRAGVQKKTSPRLKTKR